ncbi:MAG: ABC transporter permease [Erysipelotrichaceae bacterium]|nr:ABC transporter permease [Erysipelotrichaceae bacterium]
MQDERFTFVTIDSSASEHIAAPHYSYWRSVAKKFFSSKVTIFVLIVCSIIILMSAIHPMISHYRPDYMPHVNDFTMRYIRPCLEYPFGTDNVGNSLFDAVWAGTRNSLTIAFIATTITTVLGVIVGAFWGYSKKMDKIMIEIYNVVANVPFTLLVIILMYVLGRGFWQLVFALSVTSWLGTAYFIRIQVMIIRDREYNLASRCLGTPTPRIILHNILPYLISVIVTSVARDVPSFISYEVFLSYLGIGLGANTASLGNMISSYAVYMKSTPYLFWIPVAISAIISVSLYVIGQSLADAADPRTHM